MASTAKVYWDLLRGVPVTDTGGTTQVPVPVLPYQSLTPIRFEFVDVDPIEATTTPVDVSDVVAWRAAVANDWNPATEVMSRILDADIDDTDADEGIIIVDVDCASSEFLAAVTGREYTTAYMDVYGYNAAAEEIISIRSLPVRARMSLDPASGTPLDPAALYYTKTEIDVLLAGYVENSNLTTQYRMVYVSAAGTVTESSSIVTDASGNLGVGSAPAAKIHALATTEQLRLGYSAAVNVKHTVDADGYYTIAPTGEKTILTSPLFAEFRINAAASNDSFMSFYDGTDNRVKLGYDFSDSAFKINASFPNFNASEFTINATGQVGVGTITPGAQFGVLSTTEQFRASYSAAVYASHTVDASGYYTIAPTGGQTHIAGSLTLTENSDTITLTHNGSDAYVHWSDGAVEFSTTEGTNTNSVLRVVGNGTGRGEFRSYDQDSAEYLQLFCETSIGWIQTAGSSPAELFFQPNAHASIWCFSSSAEGETREFRVYGYRTGDAKRSLQIGVGVDAADTASFDGVSNYYFDGRVHALATTEQFRASYSAAVYASHTVDASGCYTIAPTGGKLNVTGEAYINGMRVGLGGGLVASNVCIGVGAMANTTGATGVGDIAIGGGALANRTTAEYDIAIGVDSLGANITGNYNVAVGFRSQGYLVGPSLNVSMGHGSARYQSGGTTNLTILDNSVHIGANCKGTQSASNEIVIGYTAEGAGSNTARWGNTSITNHYFSGDINIATGGAVNINSTQVVGAQGAAVADASSADATDLASAITLVNELKAQLNTLLARDRAHGLIAT